MLVIVSDIDKFPFKAMSNILCFCTGVIVKKKKNTGPQLRTNSKSLNGADPYCYVIYIYIYMVV